MKQDQPNPRNQLDTDNIKTYRDATSPADRAKALSEIHTNLHRGAFDFQRAKKLIAEAFPDLAAQPNSTKVDLFLRENMEASKLEHQAKSLASKISKHMGFKI